MAADHRQAAKGTEALLDADVLRVLSASKLLLGELLDRRMLTRVLLRVAVCKRCLYRATTDQIFIESHLDG